MKKEKYLEAGRIVNTHGIAGEVKIVPWADSPDFLRSFKKLYVGGVGYEVSSSRVHGGTLITKFAGIDSINDAMCLKNKLVFIDRDDAALPSDRFFIADIIGARVVTDAGRELGVVSEVMEAPVQNIYVVKGESEHLIPDVPEFILSVEPERELVTVHLIEGM